MELDEATYERWDAALDKIGAIDTRTQLTDQRVDGMSKHIEKNNGIVAALVRDSHVQEGWLRAMSAIMGLTLATLTVAGTVIGIVVAIRQFGG